MKHVDDVNVLRNWEEVAQRGYGKLYAALKPSGFLSISGYTHERMGSPDSYLLLFDRSNKVIGLRAAVLGRDKNAYRISKKKPGSNKNRTLFVRPLCEQYGIRPERTVVFHKCVIDRDGVLILNLDDVRELSLKNSNHEITREKII